MENLDLKVRAWLGRIYCNVPMFLMLILTSCATAQTPFEKKERSLGTYGKSLSTYHKVAKDDGEVFLDHDGVLIGIEKAYRDKLCITTKGIDLERFKKPSESVPNEIRRENLERITDDGKVMFISHMTTYKKEGALDALPNVEFLHNVYTQEESVSCEKLAPSKSPYRQGWEALEKVEAQLEEKLLTANKKKTPFTHIIVIAMGWNNDQTESVNRFNKIINNLKGAAEFRSQNFKPLVIGLTWPSVWGTSTLPVWKQLLHLFSYGNKADDADEIGFTYGNYIVNKLAPSLKQKSIENKNPVKVVLIGHSMGARLLTRAIFSANLLKEQTFTVKELDKELYGVDYVFGLEGAFSINRFVEGSDLIFPATLFRSGEGYPYSDYKKLTSNFIMTWSEKDYANPFSTFLNGSAHIGGKIGFKRSRQSDKHKPFKHLKWVPGKKWYLLEKDEEDYKPTTCKTISPEKLENRVFMTNLTQFIRDHNDICDLQMGHFIWEAMECFSSEGNGDGNVSMSSNQLDKLFYKMYTDEKCALLESVKE